MSHFRDTTPLLNRNDNTNNMRNSEFTQCFAVVIMFVCIAVMIWQIVESMIKVNYWAWTDETTFNISHGEKTMIAGAFFITTLWYMNLIYKCAIVIAQLM